MTLKRSGFTLVEMSIVLIIISLIAGTVFTLIPIQQTSQLSDNNLAALNTIQSAITTYVKQNNALPCPAPADSPLSSSGFGVSSDCTATAPSGTSDVQIGSTSYYVRYGVVPTRTLNLSDSYMFDAWNHRITYAVVRQMAVPTTQTINFSNFPLNFPSTQADTIQIVDANSNRINRANSPTNSNYVAYVLIARGPAGNGATRYDGTTSIACPTAVGILDKENCNADITLFMDSYYSDSASAYYDNTVRWKTYAQQQADSNLSTGTNSGGSGSLGNTLYGLFTYTVASGSDGTNGNSGNWRKRDINTTQVNNLSDGSISGNSIHLKQGKYIIRAVAASYGIGTNKLRLTTNGNDVIAVGTVSPAEASGGYPEVTGYLEVTNNAIVDVEHLYETRNDTDGFGNGFVFTGDSTPYDFLQVHVWQVE